MMTVSETSRHTSIEILAGHRAAVHWFPALLDAFPAPEEQRKIVGLIDAAMRQTNGPLLCCQFTKLGTKEIVWDSYYLKGTNHLIVEADLWEKGEKGKEIVLSEAEIAFFQWYTETNRDPNRQDRDTETLNREFNEWYAAQEQNPDAIA